MRGISIILACLAIAQQNPAFAEPAPTAESIMARVAANQDQAEAARSHYVYVQHVHVLSRRGTTLMCEETTDARVTPSPSGSDKQLLKLNGKFFRKHQYIAYTSLPPVQSNRAQMIEHDHDSLSIDIGDDDRNLIENLRANFTDAQSKDGISARLFPLTSKNQSDYTFRLIGREHLNGREVFHIDFSPKDKGDYGWKGEAYIDTTAYEPVVISTEMARKVPIAVRTLLGTNLPGLGFTVVYAPLPDGVWFPIHFGTEFKMHALFFFTREIVMDAQNRDFSKTHVSSRIIEDPRPQPDSPTP